MDETTALRSSVLTRRSSGRSSSWPDRQVKAGKLLRIAPSVYLPPQSCVVDRVLAAHEHAGPQSVVSGWAGCLLHGLAYVTEHTAVTVLVAHGRDLVSTPWVRVVAARRRPPWSTSASGIRLAGLDRCLVDAARECDRLVDVRALVLAAICSKRTTERGLRDELDASQRNGSALCRRALDDARRGALSAPEAELADDASAEARAGRLPPFLLNPWVYANGKLVGRPDGWVLGLGLGWESDSLELHGEKDDAEATQERHDGFVTRGLSLLHCTPRRARRAGAAYGAVLSAAAAARAASGYREPPGLVVVPAGPLLPMSTRRLRAWAA